MKRPVWTFKDEVLTDAPLERIISALGSAATNPALQGLGTRSDALEKNVSVTRWFRPRLIRGEEWIFIRVAPDEKGARLSLEALSRGWGAFPFLGLLWWRTDGLLDRFVKGLK
jgi:hypothetical protein